jgi:hypothetical protein
MPRQGPALLRCTLAVHLPSIVLRIGGPMRERDCGDCGECVDGRSPQKFIGGGVTTQAVDPSRLNSGVRR